MLHVAQEFPSTASWRLIDVWSLILACARVQDDMDQGMGLAREVGGSSDLPVLRCG